jgi:hypothetical protein
MRQDEDAARRVSGAEKIGHDARQLAEAAGIAPTGVTWDHGLRLLPRQSHVLQIFRRTASATAKFSDDELKCYPHRILKRRTEVKLAAMVRDLVRQLSTPDT